MFPRHLKTMNKKELERVSGISRFHEMMWIKRESGKIIELYDWKYNLIDLTFLYRSFESIAVEDGFTYKGEFIALENVNEINKKRALGYQRHNKGHSIDQMM